MKIAYVRWLDARGFGGAKLLALAQRMGALEMDSAGMLVSEDDEVIRIAQDIYTYDEEGPKAREIEIIPQKYVISKRIIDLDEAAT